MVGPAGGHVGRFRGDDHPIVFGRGQVFGPAVLWTWCGRSCRDGRKVQAAGRRAADYAPSESPSETTDGLSPRRLGAEAGPAQSTAHDCKAWAPRRGGKAALADPRIAARHGMTVLATFRTAARRRACR